jgi:hypothetical protein
MPEQPVRICPEHQVPLTSGPPAIPADEGERTDVVAVWSCPKSMCRHVLVEAVCPECGNPLEYAEEPQFGSVLGGTGHGSVVHAAAQLECAEHGRFQWDFARAFVRSA